MANRLSIDGPREPRNSRGRGELVHAVHKYMETDMGSGRGALLWLIGIPLPLILILALFMHRRLPGDRIRLRRRQSGNDALSLPSATVHGFWIHATFDYV